MTGTLRSPIKPREIVVMTAVGVMQLVLVPLACKTTHYTLRMIGIKKDIQSRQIKLESDAAPQFTSPSQIIQPLPAWRWCQQWQQPWSWWWWYVVHDDFSQFEIKAITFFCSIHCFLILLISLYFCPFSFVLKLINNVSLQIAYWTILHHPAYNNPLQLGKKKKLMKNSFSFSSTFLSFAEGK